MCARVGPVMELQGSLQTHQSPSTSTCPPTWKLSEPHCLRVLKTLCIYLLAALQGVQDLSSLTRDGTCAPCSRSTESQPLLLLLLLLLLLSRFSRVRLGVTPEMAAHQAPLSLGFSRQELHCQGIPKSFYKEMATHSSILAWRIPWMEEPGGLQSMGSQRVGHN